jgi:hypothetical protein
MPARTPVPVRVVAVSARAIRGAGRGRARKDIPSRELVAIQQLSREVAVLRGEVVEDDLRGARDGGVPAWMYRQRKPLAAVYVGLALAGAKVLILGPSFLPAIGLAVVAVLSIAAVAWVRRCSATAPKVLLEQVPSEYRWRVAPLLTPRAAAVAVTVCAGVWWVRPATLREASWTWAAAVLVGVVARAYRFRIRPALAPAEPTIGPRETWIAHVPAGDKHLERATVTGPRDVIDPDGDRIGFALTVDLPPGAPAAATFAAGVRGRTATTFGVGETLDVLIGLEPRNAARFTVTVLDVPGSSALDHVHRYTGSTFDVATGSWRQAVRADWSPALMQAYDPKHGARHIHVSGETGGGKSETLETMLRNVTASGVVAPLIIDIAQTLTDWADKVPVYVTTREDALLLLRNMLALHRHRMGKLATMRMIVDGQDMGARKVYPVDREYPMYQAYFDEWQLQISDFKVDPMAKAILKATEDVATQTRKTQQGLVLAGQATGLVPGFGNNPNIRTQCQAGGMIAHRNNNESGPQVFGNGLKVDPSKIPMGLSGAAFCASVVDQQDSLVRNIWTEHPALFDHEIDIPPIPHDEMAILMRDLSIPAAIPFALERMVNEVVPVHPSDAPAVTVGRPNLTVVPIAPSDSLKAAMKAWAREQGRPVRRGEFVKEFAETRLKASRYKVDKALQEMKEAGEFDADADGYYTLKEAA